MIVYKQFILVFLCVSLATVYTATVQPPDYCKPARNIGINFTSYSDNVAHPLHSLSVEDIRYFFDDQFPINNTIPTVNTDLTKTPILPFAPSRPSEFKFPGGAVVDYILSNNDQRNKFGESGFTNLEEITHAMHMLEMWNTASTIYKEIKNSNINTIEVCPCLVNEKENGIIDRLLHIHSLISKLIPFPIVEGVRRVPRRHSRTLKQYYNCYSTDEHQKNLREERSTKDEVFEEAEYEFIDGEVYKTIDGEEYQIVPELKDSETWNSYWKSKVIQPDRKEAHKQRMFEFAMYMYCKINFKN